MLTRIDIESENPFYVPIAGASPKDSLLLRQIDGLDPPDVDLFIGDYARDGGYYQGRRVAKRNVVFTFDLNPNPALGETVPGLREMLYKAFVDPSVDADFIKINLWDDEDRIRYLVGYTEKIESGIFSSETTSQISIVCPDPYLRDNVKTVKTDPTGWTTVPFAYTGTAETGFEVEILMTAPTPVLTLDNNGKTMIINRNFFAGDLVKINTNRGARALTVTRPGDLPEPLIAGLSPLSPWLELHSQSNIMRVYGETDIDIVGAVKLLAYTQTYWGI